MKKCALLFLYIAMLLILAVPGFAETPPTAPTIVTQPVDLSLAYAYTGGNVLSVVASAADGYTLSYQWYSNTNASNEGGTVINGATGGELCRSRGQACGHDGILLLRRDRDAHGQWPDGGNGFECGGCQHQQGDARSHRADGEHHLREDTFRSVAEQSDRQLVRYMDVGDG